LEAKGIDGLAFGIHFSIPETSANDWYSVGFRDPENGDVTVSAKENTSVESCWYYLGYTVTSDVFTNSPPTDCYSSYNYGLNSWAFYNWGWDDQAAVGEESQVDQFRFIAADENDGARWSVGDTIDLFALDHDAEEYKDNPEFVLAGSATLAAGGAALLAAVLM